MNSILRSKLVKSVSLFLFAAALSAGPARAQASGRGQFTLPAEARWGRVVLQPGNYTYSILPEYPFPIISVLKQPGNVPVALVLAQSESVDGPSDRNWLTLEPSSDGLVVTALHLQSYGIAFTYTTPQAKKKLVAQKQGGDVVVGYGK